MIEGTNTFYRFFIEQMKELFTEIFNKNLWKDPESVSWPWSNTEQSKYIIQSLPELFKRKKIKSILDIPCGDFFRQKNIDRTNIKYIGADIVEGLINTNKIKYPWTTFEVLDITKDELPKVDVIFVRDCLVHLSFEEVNKALKNICNSWSKYLLVTTFPYHKENIDIETGQRRTLNFLEAPFNFDRPIVSINEGCTEANGQFKDKSLWLRKITDIERFIK